ncbi:hypothetical protein EYC80_007022 [Monilinia laxa]|uniref:Uncharacterized protein n=1 Tax=Monilinia laxa TaxID=61186 RepID=A0A5N6JZY4_MONLA|nr:hypothetical protein EYC80_007022 [Monilinia laxa]
MIGGARHSKRLAVFFDAEALKVDGLGADALAKILGAAPGVGGRAVFLTAVGFCVPPGVRGLDFCLSKAPSGAGFLPRLLFITAALKPSSSLSLLS